ncbi:MAG: malectin domain-containing carbohydrate-binding protein, partial [Terracidiphilus sp.]
DFIADTKVFRGVRPENDGTIHIDFTGEISAMKAVEILPAPSEALLPIRIVAASNPYKDPGGNVWLPDRYVIGGRPGQRPKVVKNEQTGLYGSHRVGNFRYILPVVPFEKYRVRLYFQEPWFGKENAGIGGPGSRVFDVWCNGVALLNNFDILNEAGSRPVVKNFDNVQATALGKIELTFSPIINYPLINAIEVVPEPSK